MRQVTSAPSKTLQTFITGTFGIQPKEQQQIVQAISDAVADVAPQVWQAMAQHPGFADVGQRMLLAGAEGCGACGACGMSGCTKWVRQRWGMGLRLWRSCRR